MIHRIRNIRNMGRSLFMNVQSGQQIYFNARETLNFETVLTLNRGDVIRITRYEDFVTQMGEPTWRIFEFEIITRCLQSLPIVKVSEEGVHDQINVELQRYNRVLHWLVNPNSLSDIIERARVVRVVRTFLENHGAIEVETPILQPQFGGALARPFVTHHNTLDRDFFMRISPELYLKRMIIAGLPFVYEFARCFRNEGIDRSHNPEFTLLEFYQVDRNWIWGMEFVEEMVVSVLNINLPFQRINYLESITALGYDVQSLSTAQLDEIFSNEIEPTLQEACFVTNHPIAMSPLAYSADGIVAERFELYVNGMEIANGYTEQNDATLQRIRMEEIDNVDEDYLNALSYGMPVTCGVGIGIDRLVMLALNRRNILEVIAFPA